jgi:hypothetical protein
LHVHGEYLPCGHDGAGHQNREVRGAGANVRDRHPRPEPELLNNDCARQPLLAVGIVELVRVLVAEHALMTGHRSSATVCATRRKHLSNGLGEPEPILVLRDVREREHTSEPSLVVQANDPTSMPLAQDFLRLE